MKKWISLAFLFYVLPGLAALAPYEKQVSKGKITFYKEASKTPEQFSDMPYNTKPDPAWLDKIAPLTKPMRQALVMEDFQKMTQEELDQLYIRLSSGPIVPGNYKGAAMIRGPAASSVKSFLYKKIKGVSVISKVLCHSGDVMECFTKFAWTGKRIYPQDPNTGEYQLRNAISKLTAQGAKLALLPGLTGLNRKYSLKDTEQDFFGENKYLLLPAHLYCGQSLLDHRRESIVADYAWGSDFASISGFDDLFGRDMLNMREEMRMIRPGLYLGRVYSQKIFLFNVVLYNPDAEKAAKEEGDACFTGKTTR
jgi:hypothetical protein